MADETNKVARRVCVTGGGGYIGSWLVKNLLQKGYTVNATLRDPGDLTKSGPLLQLAGAEERLFKADLLEEGSFDSAVEACDGVFHVATPMDLTKDTLENFVVPAVKGVVNVLEACTRAKSVKRVIFTSSVAAAAPLNNKGEFIHSCLDESCWTPLDFVKSQPSVLTLQGLGLQLLLLSPPKQYYPCLKFILTTYAMPTYFLWNNLMWKVAIFVQLTLHVLNI